MKPIENIYQFFIAPVVPISRPEIKLFEGYPQLEFSLPSRNNVSQIRMILAVCWVFLLTNGILSAFINKDDPSWLGNVIVYIFSIYFTFIFAIRLIFIPLIIFQF